MGACAPPTASATTKRRKQKTKWALEQADYEKAHQEEMKRRNAGSRWDLLRTRVRARSISRGDLGVGGAGGYTFASFVNDVNAAAQEDEEERQLGATNRSSNSHRRRVLETLSGHCDERTLKALSEMVREALGQRETAATGGESKSIMVRNPSFRRQSRAARRRIESEGVGTAEGDTVADTTSLNAVGTTTGESKGSDGDERGSKNHMIREQTRTYSAAGGQGQGGARGGEVQPLHIDAVARSTSIVL